MFPFKTDKFTLVSDLTVKQVESIIENNIQQYNSFQMSSNNAFYGSIKNNHTKFKLGQFPIRNSFIPIVNLTWKATDKGTEINGYLILDMRITATFTILPLLGMYFSILNKMFIPIAVCTLFYLFLMFLIFRPIYNYSKLSTKTRLEELISELQTLNKT